MAERTCREYPVPYGIDVSVRLTRGEDIVFVDVLAPLYVNKEVRLDLCFDAEAFTDGQILRARDLGRILANRYGEKE